MIESLITVSSTGGISVIDMLMVLGCAVGLGVIVSLVYMFVNRKEKYSRGLAFTLIMLPAITSTIILLCNTMVTAFSIAGAFSIIRFRSTQGNPKDLAFIFSTLAIGLACGKGYLLAAVILVAVICVVMIALSLIGFATPRSIKKLVKITIPENLNYEGVFDEVFGKYLASNNLVKVKSTNFGTMFDLSYEVTFKKDVSHKAFIDDLRTLNGNLNISISEVVVDPDYMG